MDLHPIFVHFPIALLTIYSFFELIRRFTKGAHWFHARAVLVIFGTLGAFASLITGEQAEHMMPDRSLHPIVELHSVSATATTWMYALLAVCYAVVWIQEYIGMQRLPSAMRAQGKIILGAAAWILRSPLPLVLAIVGFLGLLFVGALGGMIVHGTETDPMTQFIFNAFFAQ